MAAPFPFQLSTLFLFAAVPPLAPPFFLAACPPINPFSALTQFIHCLSPAPLSPSLAPPFLFSARPPSIASSRTPHPFLLTLPIHCRCRPIYCNHTALVHSLLLFFCLRSPPPDSFTVATTRRLIRKRQSLFLTGVPFSSAAASSPPFIWWSSPPLLPPRMLSSTDLNPLLHHQSAQSLKLKSQAVAPSLPPR